LKKCKNAYASDVHTHGRLGLKAQVNKWNINFNIEMSYFLAKFIDKVRDKMPDDTVVHMPCYLKPLD